MAPGSAAHLCGEIIPEAREKTSLSTPLLGILPGIGGRQSATSTLSTS